MIIPFHTTWNVCVALRNLCMWIGHWNICSYSIHQSNRRYSTNLVLGTEEAITSYNDTFLKCFVCSTAIIYIIQVTTFNFNLQWRFCFHRNFNDQSLFKLSFQKRHPMWGEWSRFYMKTKQLTPSKFIYSVHIKHRHLCIRYWVNLVSPWVYYFSFSNNTQSICLKCYFVGLSPEIPLFSCGHKVRNTNVCLTS